LLEVQDLTTISIPLLDTVDSISKVDSHLHTFVFS
jgi:hypothetical protein